MKIDANGIQLDDFNAIFNDLVEKFKAIYGEDINLEQNSPDGQVLGIFANAIYDLESFLARVYNSFDPDFAEGHELDKILKLIATTRLPATKSVVDVVLTATENVVLPDDFTLIDENKQKWVLKDTNVELLAGDNTITFVSEDWGAIEAPANTITQMVTIVPQITNIYNPNPAVVGRDEETDVELRKRRNKLLSLNAKSTIGSLYSKLLNLTDVKDCIIYENSTDAYDAEKQLAEHTMWIIIDGGDIAEIAEVIAQDKTIGTGLKGSVTATFLETFVRADGTTREHMHEVIFDRPTYKNIFIKLNVKKRNDSDIIDIDAIKNALSTLNFNIAQNITATELYGTIYSAGNNFIASDLQLSKDGLTWVNDILLADYAEKFVISADNIEITEIV